MLNVGTVSAFATLDAKGFNNGIKQIHSTGIRIADDLSKKFNQLGDQLTQTGRTLTTRVTAPLLASAGLMIRAFDKQAQAEAQVRQGIISTGRAANRTEEQLFRMARELQAITRFGDEDILQGVTAQLLTFTNIASTEFDRTQKAALDLATRLGGDLQSSAIMLGKALNDPIANLGALGRAGIQFSKEQTEVIKQLAETGNVAQAQRIILAELEKQYGGSAEAAAKAGAGGIKQLWNALSDLGEEFGKIIMEYITPFIDKIREAVTFVSNMDDASKRLAVQIGAVAAALGPVLISMGLLAKAVALVLSPIMLKIAALATLAGGIAYVVKNADVFAQSIRFYFNSAASAVMSSVTDMLLSLSELVAFFNKGMAMALISAAGAVGQFANGLDLSPAKGEFMDFGQFVEAMSSDLESVLDVLKEKFMSMFTTVNPAEQIQAMEAPLSEVVDITAQLNEELEKWASLDLEPFQDGIQKTSVAMQIAQRFADDFTNSFGAGMANVVVQGEKLVDVLKNIGKLLASQAIQTGIRLLLTGGSGEGGLFGALFGGIFHTGGKVPGVGEKNVIVKGGEYILTAGQMAALSSQGGGGRNVSVNIRVPLSIGDREVWEANRRYEVNV